MQLNGNTHLSLPNTAPVKANGDVLSTCETQNKRNVGALRRKTEPSTTEIHRIILLAKVTKYI